MGKVNPIYLARKKRHARIRRHLSGTAERPRLNIFRSTNHIYAQVIDDEQGQTLAAASSIDPSIKTVTDKNKVDKARLVGKLVAERALEVGVNQVIFDRGGFRYHGRVKALAEASRKAGLKF